MITKQMTGMSFTEKESFMSYDWRGLSTDEKPTENVAINDLFLEVDTGKGYYFNGSDWSEIGG